MGNNKKNYITPHELGIITKVPKFHSEKEVLTRVFFGKGYILFSTDESTKATKSDLQRDVIFEGL